VAATAAGNALGAFALSFWGHAAPDAPESVKVMAFWGPILVWATLPGFLQWLILRHWFPRAGWWILASGVGAFLGFMTFIWAGVVEDTRGPDTPRLLGPAIMALGGIIYGAVQWLAALPWLDLWQWAVGAIPWILASTIGWCGATWVFLSLSKVAEMHGSPPWLGPFLGGAASGALSGTITGFALVLLLRHPHKDVSSVPVTTARA